MTDASRRLVLFDLDGTLIDSEPGITACLAHAFERIGAPLPAREVLRTWIGPPFRQTFPTVLGDDEARIVAAIDHYRDRFEDVGWTEHAVYDGIPELIASLAERGDTLAVVTTKPESQARLIVDHFPFGSAFARVYGPSDRHSHRSKADMIADTLRDFGARAEQTTMIGDRHFDIEGARANGVRGIGVAWGFGSIDELIDAGAQSIARSPVELLSLLVSPPD
ncbi:MAG TPA: HAD hydrolase-like protein, partial [Rhodanobacteraceae bacterium]|nr:HAD hydrolase-like protein [Rhodanobacteraceae bacterium]